MPPDRSGALTRDSIGSSQTGRLRTDPAPNARYGHLIPVGRGSMRRSRRSVRYPLPICPAAPSNRRIRQSPRRYPAHGRRVPERPEKSGYARPSDGNCAGFAACAASPSLYSECDSLWRRTAPAPHRSGSDHCGPNRSPDPQRCRVACRAGRARRQPPNCPLDPIPTSPRSSKAPFWARFSRTLALPCSAGQSASPRYVSTDCHEAGQSARTAAQARTRSV